MTDSPNLQNNIRRLIWQKNLSQDALEQKTGINKRTLLRIRQNPENAKLCQLQKIAEALDTDIRDIL